MNKQNMSSQIKDEHKNLYVPTGFFIIKGGDKCHGDG